MTKEEYEHLLKSDYWKGYSHSLIKERNFTCQDCGRRFPGEHNKLQVHHLHYRDANPWSYDPEEVVVLCEECHRRRHGLETSVAPEPVEDLGHTKTYERFEGAYGSHSYEMDGPMEKLGYFVGKYWFQIVMAACVLALVYVINPSGDDKKTSAPIATESLQSGNSQDVEAEPVAPKAGASTTKKKSQSAGAGTNSTTVKATVDKVATVDAAVDVEAIAVPEPVVEETATEAVSVEQTETKVTDAQRTMERAKTTLQLIEERQHREMVERGKKAGVSTEGSTMDILDRIQHKEMVERGKRAGVSTEGSTMDILDRIQHKEMVERGKKAGVSTEGSTMDILERIQQKEMQERY